MDSLMRLYHQCPCSAGGFGIRSERSSDLLASVCAASANSGGTEIPFWASRASGDWPGFAFIDIACHCIENNGRRLGFKSAYEMLLHFRKTYKRATDGAETLEPYEIGIVRQG